VLESRQGRGCFLFATTARLALETTRTSVSSVGGGGVKRSVCEYDQSLPFITEVKNAWR
jgi:hypothetical protein